MIKIITIIFTCFYTAFSVYAQNAPAKIWHNQPRTLRYVPDGEDFVITNGNKRFTRALYGSNTAFRVETGDLPEFALYMPGLGGNITLGLVAENKTKWLNSADSIIARYRPGTMFYEIYDSILGKSALYLQVLALSDAEGVVIKMESENIPGNIKLLVVYGGASNKKFSRNGDIGADPESSFYLKPDNCVTNQFTIENNIFGLLYGSLDAGKAKKLAGLFPENVKLQLADASKLSSPTDLLASEAGKFPVLTALVTLTSAQPSFFSIQNPETISLPSYTDLSGLFDRSEKSRKALAARVIINTPDPYLNTLGGALSVAADAIWDGTSYQHGAIAWRMPLNGWRGAYAADPLGWHNRAKTHFEGYAKAQYTTPESGPSVPDTARNFARQTEEEGVSLFTSGYISRNPGKLNKPHHYDMNLVFIDQLLTHFKWTGDTAFLREMWPVITRHLAWEKRNFDANNDGLYDAYCCIWASDALQYSGGDVTHSSAYNYRANKMAAYLAPFIGADPLPYKMEAEKIRTSIQNTLWLKKGWYAEYKDFAGRKQTHESAGLWTVYHTLDSEVPNTFEAYQTLRYVDTQIPHIPVIADGLDNNNYYTLSTTNWMPYTWSINNVVFAEVLHTALANWQYGRNTEAFELFKSSILDAMYLGSSPGNFVQVSFYDAFRGELYRDFADPIGIAARTLVEGLYGISPDVLSGTLTVKPGFPVEWDHASIQIPDVNFSYKSNNNLDQYLIVPQFQKKMKLSLSIPAKQDGIKTVYINKTKVLWNAEENAIGKPIVHLTYEPSDSFLVEIEWAGAKPSIPVYPKTLTAGDTLLVNTGAAEIEEIYDPQGITQNTQTEAYSLKTIANGDAGFKTFFIKVNQHQVSWWMPVNIEIKKTPAAKADFVAKKYTPVDISSHFNDRVTQIFKNKYLSPRPSTPTLQLPLQGIGNWCYPNVTANIDDSGLRKLVNKKGIFATPQGIPFKTPRDTAHNIVFSSQWDNYPKEIKLPLKGKAAYAWFLMAGTTNPMQSQMTNAIIYIEYTDGSADSLELRNPETWWPIEQDYYVDDFAFQLKAPKPLRVHLKTGLMTTQFDQYTTIKGFTNTAIDGGAATVLGLPLNPSKKLKQLVLKTLANDVIIGLMAVTLGN